MTVCIVMSSGVNIVVQDGRHVIPQEPDKYTPEELQLMKTQDCKYIQMKLSSETKVKCICPAYKFKR